MNGMQMRHSRPPEENRKRYRLHDAAELSRWLLNHNADYRIRVVRILGMCVIISLCNLAIPMLIGRAIDSLLNVERLMISLSVLAAVYLVSAVFGKLQGVAVSRLAQTMGFEIRGAIYRKIMKLPISYTDTHAHGDIMSRMTNDIDAVVQTVSVVIPGMLSAVITILGCTLIMWRQSQLITLVNLGIGAAMVLCGSLYSRIMFGLIHRQQKSLGDLNAVVAEAMAHRHSIHAYGKQEEECLRMETASDAMERAGIRAQVAGAGMEPIMGILGSGSFLVTAICGCFLVLDGAITIGMIQACLLYARQLLKPITELGQLLSQIQGGLACADRIRELSAAPEEEDSGRKELSNARISGEIRFEDISFSYIHGQKVLDRLNLHVHPLETIAVVGATGAGKTTLINLLLRFYEPDQGRITLDGTDIRDLSRRRLYGSLAVILQDGSMMTDTIAGNIAYGHPGATEEEIRAAASLVQADSFICQLPAGYQTVTGQEEASISYGQRQLICLARIPLMDPRILILDEATSSVDAHTEQMVQKALNQVRSGRTCIIIAHRLNTIRHVNRIVVLDGGQIVEEGTHDQLMARKGKYHQLYLSGLSE